MSLLVDVLYLVALFVLWPLLVWRRLRRGPGSLSLGERLGRMPSRPVAGVCVWVHAVSLGEVNAARVLVTELRRRSPDLAIAVSSTTATGMERARALFPQLPVFRFPIDLSPAIRSTLDRIRPTVIVLMELELWPNLLLLAQKRGIPVVVANGRITHERSMRRFRWPVLRHVARRMFSRLAWVGAQDEIYAERFRQLGTPPERVFVTGSLKYDAADVSDWIDGQEELAASMAIDRRRPLWVAGSTGPGEEAFVLDSYEALLAQFPDLQLAVVPRKPERFDEVADLIRRRGFTCLRRSTSAPAPPLSERAEPRAVFLGDTVGELRKFYALATVVFVGRTLVPMGGSDVMEVAGLAKPMVLGPYAENFKEATELLIAEGGCVTISDPSRLTSSIAELLAAPTRADAVGQAARRTIVARRGATQRTVNAILDFVEDGF